MIVAGLGGIAWAQESEVPVGGTWKVAFNHQYQTARTYPGLGQEQWPMILCNGQPIGIFPRFGERPNPTGSYTSGLNPQLRQINFAHATVIPKGPYQGWVLAWQGDSVYYTCTNPRPPGNDPAAAGYINHLADTHRYSIIDPTQDPAAATGPRPMFVNHYIDMGATAGNPRGTLFCASGAWDIDGNFVVMGGNANTAANIGSKNVLTFDPDRFDDRVWVNDWGKWKPEVDTNLLFVARWYDSVLFHGDTDNRFLVVMGGRSIGVTENSYESYTVTQVGEDLVAAPESTIGGNRLFNGPGSAPAAGWNFPRLHRLSDGRVFYCGPDNQPYRFTHSSTVTLWFPETLSPNSLQATSVLLPNFGQQFDLVMRTRLGSRYVEVCNAAANPNIAWTPYLQTTNTYSNPNLVLLPDGSVFLVGNSSAELLCLRDVPPRWRPVAASPNSGLPRPYHSCAVLLPDGRVFVTGGDSRGTDHAIFEPYYLEPGLFRTTILGAPSEMFYGDSGGGPWTYEFACTKPTAIGVVIDKIVLMRPGMSTHSSDREQRYVELQVVGQSADANDTVTLTVKPPPTPLHAPAGYYMAFAVSNQGVPSVARWVKLRR
jgi:hypothetical protein